MNKAVNRYFGENVIVTIDTGETHKGVLEDVIDPEFIGYVKISDGNEMHVIPEDQIEDIKPSLFN